MLEVRGLRAGYGEVVVLDGIDLDVAAGEVVAVLGGNGVGKSTLNNNLSGICVPFGGSIRFCGEDITGANPARIVDLGLIQVPEGRRVFPNLSVRDNLVLGSYRRGTAARARNLERVTHIFPRLQERIGQMAATLSGGEQQMLAISRALMLKPRLLLLDEPSFGLAPLIVAEIFEILAEINREEKVSMLLVEQNATLAGSGTRRRRY